MGEVSVEAGCPFELVNVSVDNFLAEKIEIEIILVITERLFDLLPSSKETKVYEGCYAHARNSRPSKLIDKLERKEEQVYPDSMSDVNGIDERKGGSQNSLKG